MTGVWLAAGLWIGFAAAALGGGASLRGWCAKEGPIEWASVVVLVVACCAWLGVAWRTRQAVARIDPWALVMLGFGLVVVGEELDWGAVLGAPGVGAALQQSVGHRNLHNFAGGHGYLVFAAVPVIAVVFGLARPVQGEGRHAAAPTRIDAAALVVAAVPSIASAWLWHAWADDLDEFGELVIYVAVLAWSIGALGRASGLSRTT